LDNAGKSVRARVEGEVARGEMISEERSVLGRVARRLEWDKKMAGSALRLEMGPDGAVVLRGSVLSEAAKLRAVDLTENTIGVASAIDTLAVAKEVQTIEGQPSPAPVLTPARVEIHAPGVQINAPGVQVTTPGTDVVVPPAQRNELPKS
jgi:hypothetical protein